MHTISARRRLTALLVLPFLLLLAGCGRMYADFEVQDVDTIELNLDIGIDPQYLEGLYGSAEEMCTAMQEDDGIYSEVVPEPYEEEGLWGCRGSGVIERADFGSGIQLTADNGEFHLVMETGSAGFSGDELSSYDTDFQQFDFRMSFAFPGDVIDSRGGEIDGDTVTYTSMSDISAGVDITAESGGFPWLIVIVIVLVLGFFLLLVLAAVAFFVIRARRNRGGSGGIGGSGGPAAPAAPAAFGAGAASPGQPWGGQASPPPAPQGGQGQPWGGQASPPPPGPHDGQGRPWDGQASPPPPAPQGDQPWSQPPQQQPGQQPPPGPQPPPGQQGWNQPPQNPGW